ncbi:MAG: c-type cytochrome [Cyclobacteriaceae bacterium]
MNLKLLKKGSTLALLAFVWVGFMTLSSVSSSNQAALHQGDSVKADRAKHMARLREAIAGKEKMPADSVFKDIQIFKGVPADRLLAIMEMGYSQSLGVSCGHCHNTSDFASSEKPQKQIAREMHAMSAYIRDQLSQIRNLKSDNPMVNCTTCHRGQVKPALNLSRD